MPCGCAGMAPTMSGGAAKGKKKGTAKKGSAKTGSAKKKSSKKK